MSEGRRTGAYNKSSANLKTALSFVIGGLIVTAASFHCLEGLLCQLPLHVGKAVTSSNSHSDVHRNEYCL